MFSIQSFSNYSNPLACVSSVFGILLCVCYVDNCVAVWQAAKRAGRRAQDQIDPTAISGANLRGAEIPPKFSVKRCQSARVKLEGGHGSRVLSLPSPLTPPLLLPKSPF
jgi:hypothetical protein